MLKLSPTKVRLTIFLAVLALAWLIAWWLGALENLEAEHVRKQVQGTGLTGVLLLIALYCGGQLLQVPSSIFVAAAVFSWGLLPGILVSIVGGVLATQLSFVVVRRIGGQWELPDRPLARKLMSSVRDNPLRTVIFARTCFNTASWAAPALALAGVPSRTHLVGTAIGIVGPMAFTCWVIASGLSFVGLNPA